ncbi:hypothetical protein I8748_34470 [Nostoc sp. CENA67]|uniref:Uncharacterized protein n=1 Tax=Amazonocrinis nigriterrae CENA67 TaxID=2794033 RepID=A0A8J7I141_9NOST|nr:hypothetical protein [Amazonocrinis nigriterrae]MBH8567197.1 hypothetical protein [Amazonocrinis nigriterrae CENA67]
MLKSLLLSGWFRAQPFLNYVVVVMLIAPLVVASGHSSSAKQSKTVPKVASETKDSDSIPQEVAAVSESDLAEVLKPSLANSSTQESDSVISPMDAVRQQTTSQGDKIESLIAKDYSLSGSDVPDNKSLAAVELAPMPEKLVDKLNLAAKNQAANIQSLRGEDNSLATKMPVVKTLTATQTAPVLPIITESQPDSTTETPAEQPDEPETAQADPIGSPHPIPWKWILATQETVGSKGSGVRYYRSVPVLSPDGRYVVYSRVQMEVKPQMYNSRVTSVLFVEDKQTKKLRVMASTATISDPLLKTNVSASESDENNGKIGVLVPVSWSEKSDRFLARKFEGVFNTGDATDHAVIWDRQKNQTNTVAPAHKEDEHEKIAVLLGWSKNQPNNVLFRAGEMGEENWPLVQVASDGKTVNTTDADQPITFGQKLTEIWAGPQVASR